MSEDLPAQTVAEYMALVRLIRDEMDAAVKPVRDDIRELKEESYTREMIDAKFELRDERIQRLQNVGSIIAGVLGALYCVLYALQIMHIIP
jgi:pheromone shutdown protein TraB